MKLMGSERSLARGLEIAARVAWILGIAFGVLLALGLILAFAMPGDSRPGPPLPVSIRGGVDGFDLVQPRSPVITEAALIVEQATLEFQPAGPSAWVSSFVVAALFYGLTMLIIHRLMKITGTLTAGRPFTRDNATRIRTIGLAVPAMWVLELAGSFAVQQFARRNFVLESGSFARVGDMNLAVLFLGLLIVVLGEVFRIGAALQDDHDATI